MTESIIKELNEQFAGAINHLQNEYVKIQTGRANAALVENLMIESYGAMMPLKGLATIAVPEAKQITIQPWARDQIAAIEKAIRNANLGVNPQNDGVLIRLILPPLTEERRKAMVKLVHQYAEEARISVRNNRHEAISGVKALEKEKKISEDMLHGAEDQVQKLVDDANKKIEDLSKAKEKDVLTV